MPVPSRSQLPDETRERWTDLDTEKPVSLGANLISNTRIPVDTWIGSHRHRWTVLRTCGTSRNAKGDVSRPMKPTFHKACCD